MSQPKILVTGAAGQLGRLVIDHLLTRVPPAQVTALVRKPEAGAEFAARGVHVAIGDYEHPATLEAALAGIDRVLLISSSAFGAPRIQQHRNVIAAAKRAGVKLLAYTSILKAAGSSLILARDHRQTEEDIVASGVPYVFLRNGWYTENYTAALPSILKFGAHFGSAGEGRIASAARADFAEAAAVVLSQDKVEPGRIYELAGDQAYTLHEFAREIGRQAGKPIAYQHLPESEFRAALIGAGLPEAVAGILSQSDAEAQNGHLFHDGNDLKSLLGRPTTPLSATVAKALGN